MLEPHPSSEALDFTAPVEITAVPAIYGLMQWGFVLFMLIGAGFCVAVPFVFPASFDHLYGAAAGFVLLGVSARAVAGAALRVRDRFTAADEGLVLVRPDGSRDVIGWSDITFVRNRPFLQRVDVGDATGRVMRLEYQLDRFDELMTHMTMRLSVTGGDGADNPYSDADNEADHTDIVPRLSPGAALMRLAVAAAVPVASTYFFGGILIIAWVVAGALGATTLRRMLHGSAAVAES